MQYSNLRRRHRVLQVVLGLSGALACAVAFAPTGAPKQSAPAAPAKRIDINSASASELKTVPGIGDAEAKKIIAGRPWLTKVDLVNKGVLPEGVYLALRDRIVAVQPARAVSRK